MTFRTIFEDAAFACTLLMAGYIIRELIPVFRKFYLPTCIVAGLVGLIIGPQVLNLTTLPASIASYGSVLVDLICTAVVWGVVINWKKVVSYVDFIAVVQGAYWIQLIYGGALGLLFTYIWPHLPIGWGTELLFSFAAGHGQAIAMGKLFEELGVFGNVEIGTLLSTVGLIVAMVIGMSLVNFGARRGWAKYLRVTGKDGKIQAMVAEKGLLPPEKRDSLGNARVPNSSVNNLLFQFAQIMALWVIGKYILKAISFVPLVGPIIGGLPSFLYGLIAALVVFPVLSKLKLTDYIDTKTVHTINGFCIDIMIVGAIATMDLRFLAQFWLPILIISVIATIGQIIFCFGYAYLICKEDWFEKAAFCFGQSTGVIASGFALYRALDPNLESSLPEVQGVGNGVCGAHTYIIMAMIPGIAVNHPGMEIAVGAALFVGFILLGWITRGTRKMKLSPIR
jgi:ESS family glutamate:Na+ symporter